jgi:hypothetical protein
MSVAWECTWVEGAVQRARSLAAAHGAVPSVTATGAVESAAEKTMTTRHTAGDMSGAVVAQHDRFATDSAVKLGAAGRTDTALDAAIGTASTITRAGCERLDEIARQSRATSRAGAVASTPAAQRIVLNALRSHLFHAASVVDSVRQQGAELARRISDLRYEVLVAPLALEPQVPTGPIVWCLRPQGTFGNYRCSVLYPDLRVGTYWSPSDDTGGSLP